MSESHKLVALSAGAPEKRLAVACVLADEVTKYAPILFENGVKDM
jgi:hypothetical protein